MPGYELCSRGFTRLEPSGLYSRKDFDHERSSYPKPPDIFYATQGLPWAPPACPSCGGGSQRRPNILWIIGEDFSPDLSCYGNQDVATPNIDRLASEGVRYTNACVTAPICSIARSALMTGMYQTSIGAHNHRSHRVDGYKLPEGVRPFTDLFREAGYHTSNLKDTSVGGQGKTDLNFNLDEPPFRRG